MGKNKNKRGGGQGQPERTEGGQSGPPPSTSGASQGPRPQQQFREPDQGRAQEQPGASAGGPSGAFSVPGRGGRGQGTRGSVRPFSDRSQQSRDFQEVPKEPDNSRGGFQDSDRGGRGKYGGGQYQEREQGGFQQRDQGGRGDYRGRGGRDSQYQERGQSSGGGYGRGRGGGDWEGRSDREGLGYVSRSREEQGRDRSSGTEWHDKSRGGRGDFQERDRGGRGDYRGRGGRGGQSQERGQGSRDYGREAGEGEQYRGRDDKQDRGGGRFERHDQGRGRGRGRGDWKQRGRGDSLGERRDSMDSIKSDVTYPTVESTWGKVEPIESPREQTPVPELATSLPTTSSQLETEVSALVTQIEQLRTSSGLAIPHRKNLGTSYVGRRGRQILIEVNHLLLDFKREHCLATHYDVDFVPTLPKKLSRQVIEIFKKNCVKHKPCAFDGKKNLYSCGELPFGKEFRGKITFFDEERQQERECEIKIKYAATVDMSALLSYTRGITAQKLPQDAIQVLDIVLRNPANMIYTPVGRSFFSPPTGRVINLGGGLELWRGFYQSVVLAWKPYLNVDVAHKGFPKDVNLITFIIGMKIESTSRGPPPTEEEWMRYNGDQLQKPLDRYEIENLDKFVKGLKVEYQIPGQPNTKRAMKVNGIRRTALQERFTLENRGEMSVAEYFATEKNYRLYYPHYPCLHIGNPANTIYVPVELCKVVKGQSVNRKLNPIQTSNMVRNAAKPTDERKQRIMEAMRNVGFNKDNCVKDFGVSVAENFTQLNARILDPPALQYRDKRLKPREGVWRADVLLKTSPLKNWITVNLTRRVQQSDVSNFVQSLMKSGRALGIDVSMPYDQLEPRVENRRYRDDLSAHFKDYKNHFKNLQLIVVFVEDKDYGRVKQAAELDAGVLTQCILSKTMSKMNVATASNILLKINAKLNGVNNSVSGPDRPALFSSPVMIVGADVTHPAPGEEGRPSVAAVTSSLDPTAFKCRMSWRLQEPKQELIVDLKNIMQEHLMDFYKRNNGLYPEKIIYYRDGVSEGQFSQVLDVEFQAIRQACACYPNYKPGITIVIVQKRHHTRFFPTNPNQEEGRGKNVPPGTIVDTDITHPKELDFYLVSHASLQGTARPTKYHKIWDDNDFDDDDLEELTFYLCHLFARCTRSVSYPAPTYYAHLAAFRARAYLEGCNVNVLNLEREQKIRTIDSHIKSECPMFFV